MRLDKIRNDYDAQNDSLEEVKRKIINILKKIHPDNNDGQYDRDYIKKVYDDLAFIESEIVKTNLKKEILLQTNDLTDSFNELNYLNLSKTDVLQDKLDKSVEEESMKIVKQFRIKRYSLASITTILTFLWMIPDKIKQHPILKYFLRGNNYFMFISILSVIWISLLFLTILYWFFTFKIERTEKRLLENIKIESVQNDLFMDYVKYNMKKGYFSKKDFMNHISWQISYKIKSKRMNKMFFDSVNETVLQDIANIVLKRAEENKIVRKVNKHSLIEHYEIIKEED